MPASNLSDQVFRILTELGPLTTSEIQNVLKKHGLPIEKDEINSILYGSMRNSVVRDVNEKGIPTWRIRKKQFSAAEGLEAKFYHELLRRNIVTEQNSQLGFTVKNTKRNIRYSLDIAVVQNNTKYDIEIDGFDHIRADALASIERQIKEQGPGSDMEIDWMDNKRSFVAYNEIDTKLVYTWCGDNIDWCVRFHEELLWPRDINRNMWLIEKGWRIIRFWNAQVRDDLEMCLEEVKSFINFPNP